MGIDESVGNRFGHLQVRVRAQTRDGLRPTHVRKWVRRAHQRSGTKVERVMGIEPTPSRETLRVSAEVLTKHAVRVNHV